MKKIKKIMNFFGTTNNERGTTADKYSLLGGAVYGSEMSLAELRAILRSEKKM